MEGGKGFFFIYAPFQDFYKYGTDFS